MTPAIDSNPAVRRALADAAAWRLLGLLLERPRKGWHEEIRALMAESRDTALRSLCEASLGATEGEYLAILGPGGIVSPREVTYRPMEDPGQILADLKGFYEAFRYQSRLEEPADHIATEAGFLGYLRMKEAYALAREDAEAASIAGSASQRFASDHLEGFSASFAGRLASKAESYLTEVAAALASRLGVAPLDPVEPFRA